MNDKQLKDGMPWAFRYEWLVLAVSVLLYIVIYIPSINGEFLWDDDENITENALIQDVRLSAMVTTWTNPKANQQYYPATHTFFWACHALWGLKTPGYHIVNMLLHLLVVIGFWRWLRVMQVKGAVFAACAVLLHPINVESVAWITEMKNTVSGMYIMFAGVFYARYRRLDCSELAFNHLEKQRGAKAFYFLSFTLYTLALFSKTVTCSFPAVLMLLIWWKQGRWQKRDLVELGPLFILGFGMGLLTWWLEAVHVGTNTIGYDYSLLERVLISGRVFWFYIGKILMPYPLNFSYVQWQIDTTVWWQYLFPLTSAALLVGAILFRRRTGRALFATISVYAGVLSPTIGLIGWYYARYSFVGDHFVYLPAMAIIAFVVHCLIVLIERYRLNLSMAKSVAIFFALIYTYIGHNHAYIFQSNEKLFSDVIAKNPRSWLAASNLGQIYNKQGRLPEAKAIFLKASEFHPDKVDILTNLANIYTREGDIQKAISVYEKAVALEQEDGLAWMNYGLALMKAKMYEESEVAFTNSLDQNADNLLYISVNLSVVQLKLGKVNMAMDTLKTLLLKKPEDRDLWSRIWGVGVEYRKMPEVKEIVNDVAAAYPHNPIVLQYKHQIMSSSDQ